ncbi:ABC transporter substrate-binding protein [Polymorphum gilvum]|uniref:ABC-type branched-chain amino acid transport systems, periplasmic component n=1 Tax=Polymorphum gilvum (strain LMG 25793 / CGMCC 1.9160 / SL003B-26A1) TaxID=991905 RepID=F2IYQ7_POLGS|nr:ABC transporter substrate-binding protein [Polymorphum gilvum]ADZ69504.1 ABC-type branched-chain amino acid transport systems, periplasmic component [Polymorphum gilvum SL003B-26A1]
MRLKSMLLAATLAAVMSLPAAAKDYVISASADYSGPFADVMPNAMAGINAVADWWNKAVGDKLGVKAQIKIYDMRYDAAVVAKTWPAILSADAPIAHLGFGTPDLVTLMKRLPNDKVPMIMGTAMVGLVWAPDGWHYSIRPTYSHEFAGLFADIQEKSGKKLRIGAISTQNQAGFVDQVNGIKKLAETYPDRFEVVDVQWAETSPVSLSSNLRALSSAGAEILLIGGTTAQVIAAAKAMEELGLSIPIVTSTHNGLYEVAKGIDLAKLNGSYAAFSFAPPARADLPLRDVFEANKKDGSWGLITAQAAAQALLALRMLEKAVAKVGADEVDGEAMRAALLDNVFTEEELLGALPTLDFDDTAPFPIGDIKASAEIVQDGKIVPVGDGWMSVPALEKW